MPDNKEKTPKEGASKQETSAETSTKKATVVKSFRSKDNYDTVHAVGEVIEASEERIDYLAGLGLVEVEKPADAGTGTGGGDNDPK